MSEGNNEQQTFIINYIINNFLNKYLIFCSHTGVKGIVPATCER